MDKNTIKMLGEAVELALNSIEQSKKEGKEPLEFPDYLQTGNNIVLAEKLKEGFKKERGRDIKFIILILQNKGILPKVDLKPIYEALKIYMDRNIRTYESVRVVNYIPEMHKFYYNKIESKIEIILNSIK